MLTGQRLTSSSEGIKLVRLSPITAGWALGTVDLDDPLVVFQQVRG
jgi:hypothetical protein